MYHTIVCICFLVTDCNFVLGQSHRHGLVLFLVNYVSSSSLSRVTYCGVSWDGRLWDSRISLCSVVYCGQLAAVEKGSSVFIDHGDRIQTDEGHEWVILLFVVVHSVILKGFVHIVYIITTPLNGN